MLELIRRLFGKQREELQLGTGDRDVITTTMSSDELAMEMLADAQEKARDLPPGATVTVEVPGNHRDVHHHDLLFSFMRHAPEFGLQAGAAFNNTQEFTKL